MLNKFLAVVVSYRFNKSFQGLEYINNCMFNRLCFLSWQRNSKTKFSLPFIKLGYGSTVVFSYYGVCLPVTNMASVICYLMNLRRRWIQPISS